MKKHRLGLLAGMKARMKAQQVLSPVPKTVLRACLKGIKAVELKKEKLRDRSMHLRKNRSLLPARTRAATAKLGVALAQTADSFWLVALMK
ncbi:hypothetical protein SPIROBIBN47_250060 [uncultured spirochete]|uniref:Uncharacterized protein n=1 Tax=uncultured spirochete TaxID=156406 RepID=A0A3P3XJC8_9SPIR|nr:hypothetical protein SPIROBIBN47_250060 [uncultured spirochete]